MLTAGILMVLASLLVIGWPTTLPLTIVGLAIGGTGIRAMRADRSSQQRPERSRAPIALVVAGGVIALIAFMVVRSARPPRVELDCPPTMHAQETVTLTAKSTDQARTFRWTALNTSRTADPLGRLLGDQGEATGFFDVLEFGARSSSVDLVAHGAETIVIQVELGYQNNRGGDSVARPRSCAITVLPG